MSARAKAARSEPGWLLPALGITLVIVIASGIKSGKIPSGETKGLPWRPLGPWQ